MSDPYTLALCYACRCPLHQEDRCGVIPSVRLAVTGPPPCPAPPMGTPGRPPPLCRNCCPEPGGASPLPWNTLRNQRPEAQSSECPHRVTLPSPKLQQPGNLWANGQNCSPGTLPLPHSSLPYAQLLSGEGYSDHSGQVGRGRRGYTPIPNGRPTPLSCSLPPPGKSRLVPRVPQGLVLPPLHLPDILWWTPRGLDHLRGPTTSWALLPAAQPGDRNGTPGPADPYASTRVPDDSSVLPPATPTITVRPGEADCLPKPTARPPGPPPPPKSSNGDGHAFSPRLELWDPGKLELANLLS